MKLWQLIVVLCVVAVVTVSIVGFNIVTSDVEWGALDTAYVNYTFYVVKNPGVDVANDKLRFGGITYGGTARRDLTVAHMEADRVNFKIVGEGSYMVSPEQEEVLLENGTATVEFKVHVPPETPYGNYSGKVIVYFLE